MPPNLEGQTLDEAFPQPITEEQAKELDVPTEEKTPEPATPAVEKKPETEIPEKEPEVPEKEKESEVEEEEPKVPLSRFREAMQQRRELRNRISELERKPILSEEDRLQLDEDKRVEKIVTKVLTDRQIQQDEKDSDDADELIGLMELYGSFDVDKVLELKTKYGSTNEGAVKAYFDKYGTGSKPKGEPKQLTPKDKVPQPKSSAPIENPQKEVDVSKPLHQIIADAKKEFIK